jgi:hypothetical protein
MKDMVRLLGAGVTAAESIRMERAYLAAVSKQFGADKVKAAWIEYVEALRQHSTSPATICSAPLPVSASAQVWACVRRWRTIDEFGRAAAGFRQTSGHFELFIPMPESFVPW